MKKILMFLLVVSACFANYDDNIKKAEERYEKQSFCEAEKYITQAIKEKETASNYYFRAKCHLGNMKFLLAINDLDRVLELDPIGEKVPLEEIYALKYNCMSFLGESEEELEKVKEIWFNLPTVPHFNATDDGLLISNIQNEAQRNLFKFLYKSPDNTFLDLKNGDLLIKKKCNCGGGCCAKSFTKDYWSGCAGSCRIAFAGINIGIIMASAKFPSKAAVAMISLAVKHLEGICIDCCKDADFYTSCVEPINDQIRTLGKILNEILYGDSKDEKEYENLQDLLDSIA